MSGKVRLNRLHAWLAVLATMMVAGLVAAGIVFYRGLVVTNLTDLVPWGLWITIDLSSIALAAGAFLLCAAVHLLGLEHLKPVARTATWVGLIGYSMALLTLLVDIGRPDRFWHALVFWNPHSLLWEIAMCITLYLGVLSLETLPIVGGAEFVQRRWPRLAALLQDAHRLAPVLAVVGLGLSLLHQSSLGAAFGVIKARPIWFRPGLSILFILSAAAGGPALTVLGSMLAARFTPRALVDDALLGRISKWVGWVLVGYLYFRFWDALSMTYTNLPGRNEGLALLTGGSLALNFWIGEFLLGALVPAIILLNDRLRSLRPVRMAALAFVALGVVLYRWDTNMVGQLVVLSYLPQEIVARYTQYTPSWVEIVSGLGIVSYGLMAFTLGVRYLKVVDHRGAEEPDHQQVQELKPSTAATG